MQQSDMPDFPAIMHAKNPKNRGVPKLFNGHACLTGNCGETLEFWVNIENDIVENVSFDTNGCGAAVSSGSIVSEFSKGFRIEDALDLKSEHIKMRIQGMPEAGQHCVELAVGVFKAAAEDYIKNSDRESD